MYKKTIKYRGVRQAVHVYLQTETKARERSNKNRAISNLVVRRFIKEIPGLENLRKDQVVKIVEYVLIADKDWRFLLQKHDELRGTDYEDKKNSVDKNVADLHYKKLYD